MSKNYEVILRCKCHRIKDTTFSGRVKLARRWVSRNEDIFLFPLGLVFCMFFLAGLTFMGILILESGK